MNVSKVGHSECENSSVSVVCVGTLVDGVVLQTVLWLNLLLCVSVVCAYASVDLMDLLKF